MPQVPHKLGVTNGAGVFVVRAKREIDFVWFFLGGNPKRPFYKPLIENETKENRELRSQLDFHLLAAARAEAAATRDSQRETLPAQFRKVWSDNVGTFLRG